MIDREALQQLIQKLEVGLARSVTADNGNYTAVSLTVADVQQLLPLLADVLGSPTSQDQKNQEDTRVDERTDSPLPVTTAGENQPTPLTASDTQVSNGAKPYFWVDPNPAGVARQLMTVEDIAEFLREIPEYAVAGEGITATLVFMTDAEVEALPDV